jgi:hypothetical protein
MEGFSIEDNGILTELYVVQSGPVQILSYGCDIKDG